MTAHAETTNDQTFTCPNCGAMQRFDAARRSLVCPFCGTAVVRSTASAASPDPPDSQMVIPFMVTREQSVSLLRTWLGGGRFAPGDLKSRAALDAGTGVYIPFYRFDCTVHSNWTGENSEVRYRTQILTDSSGNVSTREVGYTVWNAVSGQHDGVHETLIPASTGLTQEEADGLLPFPRVAVKSYLADYLAGYVVEEPSVSSEKTWKSGEQRIRATEQDACGRLVEQIRTVNTRIEERVDALVWIPVWVYLFTYKEIHSRVLVNGLTGVVHGNLPVSRTKVTLAILLALLAIAVGITFLVVRTHA